MHALSRTARIGALALVVAAALFFGAAAAKAQNIPCGDRGVVLEHLKKHFGEKRSAVGVTANGRLIEVMTGPQGSWTILVSYPGGPTCLILNGEGWRQIVEPPDEAFVLRGLSPFGIYRGDPKVSKVKPNSRMSAPTAKRPQKH